MPQLSLIQSIFFVLSSLWVFNASALDSDRGAREMDRRVLDSTTVQEGIPSGIVHLSEDLPEILWVDLKDGDLYRLKQTKQGWFSQPESIPVSLGKQGYHKRKEGDLKTPVGVFHITSYLEDSQLASKYGDGAFPVNYPSGFDRLQGRTGSGIWIHGLPKGVTSRPLLDSDGCVVLDNETLNLLKPVLKPRETMVVLAEDLEWLDARPPSYDDLMQTIERWRDDWQSLSADQYFSHYDTSFTDLRRNFSAWKKYKRRVNGNKQWIKVDMSRLSVIVHPEKNNLVSMRYYQNYRSSNYNWRGWKQMLWQQQENGQWLIIYEGNS